MSIIWSERVDSILSVGLRLDNIGVRNWALNRNQAFRILDQFEMAKIGVLGGDVYQVRDGVFQSTYDNWYCEKLDLETEEVFARRSIHVARSYIENYNSPDGSESGFAIVPAIE